MALQVEAAPEVNPAASVAGASPSRFHVLIAYDEPAGGERGMEMFVQLQRDSAGVEDCHCDLWRFDLLGLPGVGEAATLAGLNAQVIVVAARRDVELPTPVKHWLGHCLGQGTTGGKALVALLHSGRDGCEAVSPSRVALEMLARRYGLGFFAQEISGSESGPALSIRGLRERLQRSADGAGGVLNRRPRPARWGINE